MRFASRARRFAFTASAIESLSLWAAGVLRDPHPLLALLLATIALRSGNWWLLLLWPALSLGLVGLGYLSLGHRVFGKRLDGSLSPVSAVTLFPYLLVLWAVWHIVRLLPGEAATNTLVDGVIIGRRLLSSEMPSDIRTVVDFTSEFREPKALRSVPNYIAAPLLDASVRPFEELADLAFQVAQSESPIYIHCAQGHGRTGLIAGLVLIVLGHAEGPDTAIKLVETARPKVRLNHVQRAALVETALRIQQRTSEERRAAIARD